MYAVLACACHSRRGADLSLVHSLKFKALVRGIFWNLLGVSLRTLVSSPSSLVNGLSQWNKTKNKCNLSSVKLNSWIALLHHLAHANLHIISTRYAALDLHTIAPWPRERMYWMQFAAQIELHLSKSLLLSSSSTSPFYIIIIITTIIIIVIVIIITIIISTSPSSNTRLTQ